VRETERARGRCVGSEGEMAAVAVANEVGGKSVLLLENIGGSE